MKIIKIAQIPAPKVSQEDSVSYAVHLMERARGGACVVVDDDALVGIFTERDVMLRVVGPHLDPKKTEVGDVMSFGLDTITPDTDSAHALDLMVSKHIRHLPIVDENGKLLGLLSMRNVLHYHVEDLVDQLNSLEAYISADGPGG